MDPQKELAELRERIYRERLARIAEFARSMQGVKASIILDIATGGPIPKSNYQGSFGIQEPSQGIDNG